MSVLRKTARRSLRLSAKATAVAAVGVAIALGTTACGAGQISQTANQEPAVNGNMANLGSMQLRNVQIIYPAQKADEVFDNGGPFEVSFVVNNVDPVENDRLLGIDAPKGGSVTIVGDTTVKPGQALRAGKPIGLLEPEEIQATDEQDRLTVRLNDAGDSVAAGLTTPLTFRFERAGSVTMNTPVDAGTYMTRQDKIREAEPPADEHAGEEH
ncbi:hypothetical protein AAFP35_15550 [Gordonia sp. CPCC 206044]|uniref:hypothetical protein n=1 Tax=Gordonia sp. CPCC 206044 TaxID=3140793 RepID=UPI003AF3A35C